MRAKQPKQAPIREGSWVGIDATDNSGEIYDCGLTSEQISRLREGRFVAVKELNDSWLCWDVKGNGEEFRVPTELLLSFPELDPREQQEIIEDFYNSNLKIELPEEQIIAAIRYNKKYYNKERQY